jgi:hypothetical protein
VPSCVTIKHRNGRTLSRNWQATSPSYVFGRTPKRGAAGKLHMPRKFDRKKQEVQKMCKNEFQVPSSRKNLASLACITAEMAKMLEYMTLQRK